MMCADIHVECLSRDRLNFVFAAQNGKYGTSAIFFVSSVLPTFVLLLLGSLYCYFFVFFYFKFCQSLHLCNRQKLLQLNTNDVACLATKIISLTCIRYFIFQSLHECSPFLVNHYRLTIFY